MNTLFNKLSKIDFVADNAVRLINLYKTVKLQFINFEYDKSEQPSLSKEALIDYNRNRKFTASKNLCFAPQKSMIFSFDGSVYVCCENKQYSLGNIKEESVHDIWFGERRKFIHHKINTDYNLDYGCSSCKHKILNKDYSLALSQTFDIHTSNRSAYPARLDFEIHNTCNLECVMCGGIYSSSIQANRYNLAAIPMVYGAEFVEQLTEFIPHVRYINLIGGEPTLIKLYYDIIEKVIELNPSCVIHLQTNASTLNKKFRQLLERGNFQIGISLDALQKEPAESIRKNLDFDKFMQHVEYYLQLYRENKIKLTINTCPMPNNWKEIIPILKFCNRHRLPLFFCIVNAPHYNTFLSASEAFIDEVLRNLHTELLQLPKTNYYEKNNYSKLEDFLNLLNSWKTVVRQNNENRTHYIRLHTDELYTVYTSVLDKYMMHENKTKLIAELTAYTKEQFDPLEEATKRELLIVLINSVKSPIIPPSEAEQLKWGKEFVNTLIFSHSCKTDFL
jgi:radical SAM protein with 4Fe4S-binding SPASM domain